MTFNMSDFLQGKVFFCAKLAIFQKELDLIILRKSLPSTSQIRGLDEEYINK